MQSRVDAIEERDGKDAITGRGIGIGYLLARDVATALRASAAHIERLEKALTRCAEYLEALEDNLQRNDVDMMIDKCEAPSKIAEEVREALAALRTGGK